MKQERNGKFLMKVLNILTSNLDYNGIAMSLLNYYRNIDESKVQLDYLVPNKVDKNLKKEFTKKGNKVIEFDYNGTTYNLPIVAELSKDDSNALRWAGTDTVYGVFDDLELANGPTTAITLLTRKIIKDTDVYKKVKNLRMTL